MYSSIQLCLTKTPQQNRKVSYKYWDRLLSGKLAEAVKINVKTASKLKQLICLVLWSVMRDQTQLRK